MIKFTLTEYRKLLNHIKSCGYIFATFEKENLNSDKKLCFVRHDIDADVEAAYKMAFVESELGIQSTYFFMLRSAIYNLMSRRNFRRVQEIISMKHAFALHYDEGFYPDKERSLQKFIDMEVCFLEDILNLKIKAISFHQPSKNILENKVKVKGLLNTYDKKDMKSIFYFSDSNMNLRYNPYDVFSSNEYNKIQMLIHPIWWMGKGKETTFELWDKALISNFYNNQEQLYSTEAAFGKKRKINITRK